jgi:hypothetical protein
MENAMQPPPALCFNDIPALLKAWKLSDVAIARLAPEREIVADLVMARQQPPLPPGYVPTVIEVLFDDIPYIRSEHGRVVYIRPCRLDYQPPFVEYRFDGEMAVFQVGGEYVVNRAERIAETIALQGLQM